jgi:hypothetical protein
MKEEVRYRQQSGKRPSLTVRMLAVVGLVALDETPSVDVDDETSAALLLAPEEIKPADHLTERVADLPRVRLLVVRELGDETDLLAIRISTNEPVHDRRLSRLGVRERRTDSVDLDVLSWTIRGTGSDVSCSVIFIRTICLRKRLTILYVDELLVDVRPVRPGSSEIRVMLRRLVANLPGT